MTPADDAAPEAGRPGPVRPPVPASGPVYGPPVPVYGPPTGYGPPPGYGYGHAGWRPQPVPVTPDGRPLADFGTRLLAYMIDSALVSAVLMVIFVPIFVVMFFDLFGTVAADPYATPDLGAFTMRFLLVELALLVLALVGYYVYYVEVMHRTGQTLGKKLMKLRVVPLEPGARLTRGRAARRYLVEIVAGMFVPLFSTLNGLWQLWDKPYQQTLHDKAAQTVVIKVAP